MGRWIASWVGSTRGRHAPTVCSRLSAAPSPPAALCRGVSGSEMPRSKARSRLGNGSARRRASSTRCTRSAVRSQAPPSPGSDPTPTLTLSPALTLTPSFAVQLAVAAGGRDAAQRHSTDAGAAEASKHVRSLADDQGETRDYNWHLGYILPKSASNHRADRAAAAVGRMLGRRAS